MGAVVAAVQAARSRVAGGTDMYRRFRQQMGRSILLGLGLLVALIVLIRTFLSFSLELEITGRWPWQNQPRPMRRVNERLALGPTTLSPD